MMGVYEDLIYARERIDRLVAANDRLRKELDRAHSAIAAILPFVASDFTDGDPYADCCATKEYRGAYRKLLEAKLDLSHYI